MGEMRQYFDAYKEIKKAERIERNNKYEPKLIELGTVKKSMGVYELNS